VRAPICPPPDLGAGHIADRMRSSLEIAQAARLRHLAAELGLGPGEIEPHGPRAAEVRNALGVEPAPIAGPRTLAEQTARASAKEGEEASPTLVSPILGGGLERRSLPPAGFAARGRCETGDPLGPAWDGVRETREGEEASLT
jgi:hypothetical protein